MMRSTYELRKGIFDIVAALDATGITMVEIGSYAGESAELFLRTGRVARIVCIDPWESDPDGDEGNTYTNMDAVEREFDSRAIADSRIVKFKGTVDTFIGSDVFKGVAGSIDFVYIDGLHTYDGCMNDLSKAFSTLKPRLAVGGHDYADWPEHIRGVKKAVNEKVGTPDMTFCDTSWLKFVNK